MDSFKGHQPVSYSVRERSRKFMNMTTQVKSYPVAELFNHDGQQGLLQIGKTKFYEALRQLRIEAFPVGREKHITPEQKDLVEVWLSKSADDQAQMVAELYGGELAIAPQASMVQQPEMMAAFMEAVAKHLQPQANPVQDLRDRLETLRYCAEHKMKLPTAELALLMGVRTTTISGRQSYSHYGFNCTNTNFKGGRSEWLVELE